MKATLALLRYAAFALACLVAIAVALLLWIEKSGWLRELVRDELSGRLGELGPSLELRAARLHWLEPGLEIEGLALGERGETLAIDGLRVRFDLTRERWLAPARVEVIGGHARIGEPLLDALSALNASLIGEPAPAVKTPTLPILRVRDLWLEFASAHLGIVSIGSVDLLARASESGALALEGRVTPRSSGGEPGSTIALSGRELPSGRFELLARTHALGISSDALPRTSEFDALRALAPRAELDLDLFAVLDPLRLEHSSARVRATVKRASMALPAATARVEDLRIELDGRCDPEGEESLLDLRHWDGAAEIDARWKDTRVRGWALAGERAGGAGTALAWASVRDLALSRAALLELGATERALDVLDAVEVAGRTDAWLGVRWSPGDEVSWSAELAPRGELALVYRGFPHGDGSREGFPLPIDGVRGRVVVMHDRTFERPTQVAIVAIEGTPRTAPSDDSRPAARCQGVLRSPLESVAFLEYDLHLESDSLPIGETLHGAIRGLDHQDWIWKNFAPRGGSVSSRVHLRRLGVDARLAGQFDLELARAGILWEELPIPFEQVEGKVSLRFDPRGVAAVGFALEGLLAGGSRTRVSGRDFEDPAHADRTHAERVVHTYRAQIDGLSLRGAQRDRIVELLPGVGKALGEFGAAGLVDFETTIVRALPGGTVQHFAEILPQEVQLTPLAFQVQTRSVQGRAIVTASVDEDPAPPDDSAVETRLLPLVGEWAGGTRIAAMADFPSDAADTVSVAAAGVDPENRALVGALRDALAGEGGGGMDLGELSIGGRLDFDGGFEIPERGGPAQSRYRIQLRDNDLQVGKSVGLALADLRGTLERRGDEILGDDLRARIGRTAIRIGRARFAERDGVFHLEAEPEARGMTLDREHLGFFLDDATLDSLEESFKWSGSIDIVESRLTYTGRSPSDARVSFRGLVLPRDVMLDLGLPIAIESGRARIGELIYEHDQVRAWGEVTDLVGRVAGRRLSGAQMLVTYIEPHVSLLDLTGELEGGSLTGLGGAERAGAPALAIDLEPPFAFDLGLRLSQVDVGGLLRGLFESEFASSGRLTGNLRLAGNLDLLTGIRGRGEIELSNTRLWSIPVVRDLFAQLGFETPAIFERARSRFDVRDGVIDMKSVYVHSPLLQLVGSGTLDLDGRLHHDLEVRYSIVDQLGPFRRFLYWIQNNLLRVSIRGDMARPKVILRGILSFFQRSKTDERDLPLPAFTPLGERF